jgi:hypothetical protein
MAEGARQAKAAEPARTPEPARPKISRRALDSRVIQTSLRISQPTDPAEAEADRVARAVVSMPDPGASSGERSGPAIQRKPTVAPPAPTGSKVLAAAANPDVEAQVRNAATGGAPLPGKARAFLEPRFRASFAGVSVHTDSKAAGLSAKLGAKAFTYGSNVFFGGGAYDHDSKGGMELIAHELTHTIQQGGAIQRKAIAGETQVTQRTGPQASRLGLSDALNFFADAANAIPGYRMFTILLGMNPINGSAVEASAANILRAIVEFMPGGFVITQVLDSYGIFDKVGGWIEGQLKSLGISGSSIKAALDKFMDSLSWKDIFNLGGVWDRAKAIFTEPIGKIISFAKSLVGEILRMVQEAVMKPLAALAESVGGYTLLKAVMGKDPVTGQAFPRTPETVIGGFMEMIGQQELWGNIQRAKAIPRAWAWFQGAMAGLISLVTSIPDRFMSALKALTIVDFVALPSAFAKLVGVFGTFMADFGAWALGTVIDLAKIIVEVVAPGVMPYIAKAGAAFNTIVQNPVRFVQTLVAAAMAGFNQFKGNFLTHLKASLIGWLTGALGGAGVYVPQGFSLSEIVKFVLSVLGLTWTNVRAKLVKATSETTVKAFETGFDLVKKLVTEGPAAVWQQITESLTNLKEMVITQAMDFVKSKVVEAAVTKLLSMLSPAGALIQAIIAIWNTIMFFKERISQIAAVAASFIDSIAAIAAGNIGPAANRVEQTMAGMLTLVISFLARIAGLGKVSDAILNIVKKIRAPIDKGLDKAVTWVVGQAKKLGKLLVDKVTGKANRTPQDIERDKQKAQRELPGKVAAFLAGEPMKIRVRAQLMIWKLQYKLADLKLVEAGKDGKFVATINPTFDIGGPVPISIDPGELIILVNKVCVATLKNSKILARERTRQRKEEATQTVGKGKKKTQNTNDPRITSKGARSTLAFATRLRERERIKDKKKRAAFQTPSNPRFILGQDKDGKDIEVSWRRLNQKSDWNRVIEDKPYVMRPYLGKGGSLERNLPKGKKTIEALETIGKGGQLPKKMKDPQAAGELSALMYGQEVARSPENVAFSAMAMDEMKDKNLSTPDMLKSLPAGPTGASATQREILADAKAGTDVVAKGKDKADTAEKEAQKLEKDAAKMKGPALKIDREIERDKAKEVRAKGGTYKEVLDRTIKLVTDWINTQLKSSSPVTKTKKGFTNWLEKKIRERVNKVIKDGN